LYIRDFILEKKIKEKPKMWIILGICMYFVFIGLTFKAMLIARGYAKYSEVETGSDDTPLIAMGSVFWPFTALVYLGITITKIYFKKMEK
jgi:hypothetical protein